MARDGVTGVTDGAGALGRVPPQVLDDMSPDELRAAVLADVARSGEFTQSLADRLDGVFTVKAVRLLRSPHARAADLRSLDDLIAGIARDKFAAGLDSLAKPYFSRWRALRDMLAAARRLDDHALALREASSDEAPSSAWEAVAERVIGAGQGGMPLSELAAHLQARADGPRSKSGVSQLITAMRAQGWVDTLAQGRTKRVFAGTGIGASIAWRKANPSGRAAPAAPAASDEQAGRSGGRFADLARRVACLNQGAYIEYSYLAHEYHRELRERYDASRRPDGTVTPRQAAALTQCAKSLLAFVDSRFKAVALQNFEVLRQHFQGRSEVLPRLCLKGNWSRSSQARQTVASILRDDGSGDDGMASPSADNTGFQQVIATGKYYGNADLARAALLRTYRNPRLDPKALDALRGRLDLARVESGQGFTADEWLRCWTDWREDAEPRRFYRSTLIVPMTLRNNNLSTEFREKLGGRLPQLAIEQVDRSILGLLCMDHPQAHFFNDEDDVAIGYMVADQLSLYIFTRMVLTTLSKVFQGTLAASPSRGTRRLDELLAWAEAQMKEATPLDALKALPVLDIQATHANHLVSLSASFQGA